MTKIKDLVPESSKNKSVDELFKEMRQLNKIVVLKEEDEVIRSIIRGKTKKQIVKDLNDKHNYNVTISDLNEFIDLYRDVLLKEKKDIENKHVRRVLRSHENLANSLTELSQRAQNMIDKYDEQGDNSNAVNALKATADIMMKVAKLQGYFNESPEVNVNMEMDRLVQQVSSGNSSFKDSVMKVLNNEDVIDADYTEEDENGSGEKDV